MTQAEFHLSRLVSCPTQWGHRFMRRTNGGDVRVVYTMKRSFDVPRIYLDIRRATDELAWRPVTPFEVGIRKSWEFIRGIVSGR